MKTLLKKTTLLPAVLLLAGTAWGQAKPSGKAAAAGKAAPKAENSTTAKLNKKTKDGYTVLPSGVQLKVVKKGKGTRKAAVGDYGEMFVHMYVGDSLMFDSRKMFNATKPVPISMRAPANNADLMHGFLELTEGDSAVVRISVDSMLKAGSPPMPGVKENSGQMVRYEVQLETLRTEEEQKKFTEESAGKQKGIDEKMLQDYFAKNKIKAQKTASGLYYTVSKPGTGENAANGQTVSVNYTGKLLDGNTFDSNTDPAFKHTEPFKLALGKGQVIKGWDEGLQLFNKGAKGTLYIPSGLAYGSQDRSPQIPANSILVFDIEILDIADAPKVLSPADQAKLDDQLLQSYFKDNKIQATKTPSGLYYTVSQKGLGPTAAAGKKVTVNYTGKTMDGKIFDSNTDPKFNHVQPFEFQLGAGQVIKGWDEGIQLLQLGSRGTLFIPSGMAYGQSGMGSAIPPNSILMFDVEVVGID
jgi:FKBP-type peptidyl-prolyl cis-trans isomerase FkpA